MAGDNGVERTLGKLLATQELILDKLDYHMERLETHIKDDLYLAKRIDKIETRMSWIGGVAAAVIFFWSITSDMILTKIGLK